MAIQWLSQAATQPKTAEQIAALRNLYDWWNYEVSRWRKYRVPLLELTPEHLLADVVVHHGLDTVSNTLALYHGGTPEDWKLEVARCSGLAIDAVASRHDWVQYL